MRLSKLVIPLALLLMIGLASQTRAEISDAAVLYLRIAPGARAAGMGEAYVAISDDATSTHWNPAGLGAYPLSPNWTETNVPGHLRPLKQVVALKSRGGSDFSSYDIWAITPSGLARYDNKEWFFKEVFATRTDQTLRRIVASYFNLTDDDLIDRVVARVAADNSPMTLAEFDSLTGVMVAAFPEDYDDLEALQTEVDSLLEAYNENRVDWSKFEELRKEFDENMKDGSLSATESEKLFFAVSKCRLRFLPEELTVEYSTLFEGEPTSLAAAGDFLVVGTDNGLYTYDGERWQSLSLYHNLPSRNITSLVGTDYEIFIGTDNGVASWDGENLSRIGEAEDLPAGFVSAIASGGGEQLWAVVDNRLYFFDGEKWSDNRSYTVVLDDTWERIAEKISLYGTAAEKEGLVARLKQLNPAPSDDTTAPSAGEVTLETGAMIQVPFVYEFKGDVGTMVYDVNGRLWFGTSYGVVYWDIDKWVIPGYRLTEVTTERTVDALIEAAGDVPLDGDAYRKAVMDINDLTSNTVPAGSEIRLYGDPTAAPVTSINRYGDAMYFATTSGLIVYEGGLWQHSDLRGLDKADVISIETHGNGLWFATEDRLVTKANGRTDISLMYVKWLPELADDLYYAFASAAWHKEGWGTFGGNITFINYGEIIQTTASNIELGSFEAFDLAITGSYGTPITRKLKLGGSAKLLYSKLAPQGTGDEQGEGTSTGFAIDVGMLYALMNRLNLGVAITNLGPDMAYIDAAQSDPLPRNLAVGLAYMALQRDYYHLLVTAEMNKSLVGVDDPFREELKQLVLNGGAEFLYNDVLALRAGYIYDQEGDIKTATLGVGIGPLGIFKFDFSYIPSNTDAILANTLRVSLSVQP